jgi:hypothetical protein
MNEDSSNRRNALRSLKLCLFVTPFKKKEIDYGTICFHKTKYEKKVTTITTFFSDASVEGYRYYQRTICGGTKTFIKETPCTHRFYQYKSQADKRPTVRELLKQETGKLKEGNKLNTSDVRVRESMNKLLTKKCIDVIR